MKCLKAILSDIKVLESKGVRRGQQQNETTSTSLARQVPRSPCTFMLVSPFNPRRKQVFCKKSSDSVSAEKSALILPMCPLSPTRKGGLKMHGKKHAIRDEFIARSIPKEPAMSLPFSSHDAIEPNTTPNMTRSPRVSTFSPLSYLSKSDDLKGGDVETTEECLHDSREKCSYGLPQSYSSKITSPRFSLSSNHNGTSCAPSTRRTLGPRQNSTSLREFLSANAGESKKNECERSITSWQPGKNKGENKYLSNRDTVSCSGLGGLSDSDSSNSCTFSTQHASFRFSNPQQCLDEYEKIISEFDQSEIDVASFHSQKIHEHRTRHTGGEQRKKHSGKTSPAA